MRNDFSGRIFNIFLFAHNKAIGMASEIAEFAITLNDKSLEEMLLIMVKHGKPRISQMSNGGWFSVVEMRVSSEGVNFDVQSDFNHKTPTEAAKKCLLRILETLNKYGVKV